MMPLASVVTEAINLLRASLPATIEIHQQLDPACPPVRADAAQMHQVLVNLCTNALHAMTPQGGRLEIAVAAVNVDEVMANMHPPLRPGRHARLTVADTGRGMTPATLERIFEPFFTTKTTGEGTGLGLAVVHGIVHAHDGAITVSSEPGRGTTCHVYLPAAPPAAPGASAAGPAMPGGRGEHILLVDDEKPLIAIGRRVLERLGYQVTAFVHPEEALAAVRAQPAEFALVITDLTMPGLRGTELAAQIVALRGDLPIILATGYGGDLDPQAVQAAGITEIIAKPYNLDDLATTLARVLGARRNPPAA